MTLNINNVSKTCAFEASKRAPSSNYLINYQFITLKTFYINKTTFTQIIINNTIPMLIDMNVSCVII